MRGAVRAGAGGILASCFFGAVSELIHQTEGTGISESCEATQYAAKP